MDLELEGRLMAALIVAYDDTLKYVDLAVQACDAADALRAERTKRMQESVEKSMRRVQIGLALLREAYVMRFGDAPDHVATDQAWDATRRNAVLCGDRDGAFTAWVVARNVHGFDATADTRADALAEVIGATPEQRERLRAIERGEVAPC